MNEQLAFRDNNVFYQTHVPFCVVAIQTFVPILIINQVDLLPMNVYSACWGPFPIVDILLFVQRGGGGEDPRSNY